ncbi:MAG: Eco57I restriction-modification methylase domain-containing protein, partial [Bacteroidales bacterium]
VRIQNLVKYAPEEIKYYQSDISGYSVAKKDTIDKYYVFIQRAIALLNSNGLLGYIVPHKFFIIKGGNALREFITSNCQISKITHFGVTQVFPDRSTYTAILILQKERKPDFHFKRVRKITPELLEKQDTFVSYQTDAFNTDPWIFLAPDTEKVFNNLRNEHSVPLKELADICVGLQTSADKIYIFEPESETSETFIFKKKEKLWEVEKKICLPAIHKANLKLFDVIEGNSQIIFPYEITNEKAILISEEKFKKDFPLCYKYLESHKDFLLDRKVQKKKIGQHYIEALKKNEDSKVKWYQFGRSQSLTRFQNTPKLVWSVLANSSPYALDNDDIQFTGGGNGPYYALINRSEYSLLYFLGILSHPLFENMVKAGASEFRGAYYSHGKQFIENIPIRKIDFENASEKERYTGINKLVESLIKTKSQLKSAPYGSKRTVYQRKADTLMDQLIQNINLLYGISEEEFRMVMNDDMFTTELAIEE